MNPLYLMENDINNKIVFCLHDFSFAQWICINSASEIPTFQVAENASTSILNY